MIFFANEAAIEGMMHSILYSRNAFFFWVCALDDSVFSPSPSCDSTDGLFRFTGRFGPALDLMHTMRLDVEKQCGWVRAVRNE